MDGRRARNRTATRHWSWMPGERLLTSAWAPFTMGWESMAGLSRIFRRLWQLILVTLWHAEAGPGPMRVRAILLKRKEAISKPSILIRAIGLVILSWPAFISFAAVIKKRSTTMNGLFR